MTRDVLPVCPEGDGPPFRPYFPAVNYRAPLAIPPLTWTPIICLQTEPLSVGIWAILFLLPSELAGPDGSLEFPPAARGYVVLSLTGRRIQAGEKRGWCTGVRLEPNARRGGPDGAKSLRSAPPALRGTSVRELATFLPAPEQAGYPPT